MTSHNNIMPQNNIMLRRWQKDARSKILSFYGSGEGHRFLLNAAPGAGKTLVSCVVAADLIANEAIKRVIIIAPRSAVVGQWAKVFEDRTKRHMMRITAADDIHSITSDVCATWSAVQGLADVFQAMCDKDPVLVICDEHHHAALEAAWGASADSAFRNAAYVLVLTGTPSRSDGAKPVWLDLDNFGAVNHPEAGTYTLNYGDAVRLGYCRPVTFHRHRGRFTVDLGNGHTADVSSDGPPVIPEAAEIDDVLRRVVDFQRLARTPQWEADGVTPKMDGYQGTMMASGIEKLDEIQLGMPSAGGLVIAPDIRMAEYFASLIHRMEGKRPMVVHSNLSNPDGRIGAFRNNPEHRWLVAVGMVSEGVDIPRLRVLVYLPNAMTELAFRQAIGRVVRSDGPNDRSRAYVVMPAFEIFDEYARRIEDEMPAMGAPTPVALKQKRCAQCGGLSLLGAGQCLHCGFDFPSRKISYRTCIECGSLNRLIETECINCGHDMMMPYQITLAEAARDGVIVKGIFIPEDDVCRAEELTPAYRAMVARAERENRALAQLLRTVPIELLPEFAKLFQGNWKEGQMEALAAE